MTNFVVLNDNLKLADTPRRLLIVVSGGHRLLAEQALDISGVQPKVAVMSLTLNRPKCNEHDQQYARQTHGFVAPLPKPQYN